MKFKFKKRRYPVIPLSSTSDIGFLLLIFIMLISLINYRKEIKIDYPEAKNPQIVQEKKNFELWIDEAGNVYYDGKTVPSKIMMEQIIVDAILKKPDLRIHIIADRNTKYKYINDVVEELKLLQHRVVSFVVKESE